MVISQSGIYKIVYNRSKGNYLVINTKGKYENHGHFKKVSTCYVMIDLLNKRKVPNSKYLLEAALRITTDEKYKEHLLQVQHNRNNKEMYYNVNKGVKKRR